MQLLYTLIFNNNNNNNNNKLTREQAKIKLKNQDQTKIILKCSIMDPPSLIYN